MASAFPHQKPLSVGAWSMLGTSSAASVMAQLGADWLVIDGQHGLYDDRAVVDALAVIGSGPTPTLVRMPRLDEAWIGRALDAGASGVIVPMVNTAEQARLAAAACRYAPVGTRSWGPMAAYWGGTVPTVAEANAAVHCAVMVETREAVANVTEIAATPGVDMVFVGPFDLSIALGLSLDELLDDDSPESALDAVVAACTAADVIPGAFAGSIPVAKRLVARGFRAVGVAVDTGILMQSGTALVGEARALGGETV